MTKETIELLVDGGNADPGPPLGPALGPLGVNTAEVIKDINDKTKGFSGMKIPVKVIVDTETKAYEVGVGSPPSSALIKKELGVEKGSTDGNPVGDLSFQQVLKIADMKKGSLLANDTKSAIKEVVGTCQSVHATVEGRTPKEITEEIDKDLLDDVISGKTTQMPELVVRKEEEIKIVGQEEKPEEVTEEEAEGEEKEEEEKAEGKEEEKAEGKEEGKEKKGEAKGKKGKGKSDKSK